MNNMNKTIKKLQDAVKVAQLALLAAEALEQEVSLAALASASFLNEETGEQIVDPKMGYMMSDDDFHKYLEIVRQHFLSRGIDNPFDASYTYPFEQALKAAEDTLLDACSKAMPLIGKQAIEKARNRWKFRPQLIDLSLRLDGSTIPA